METYIPFFAFFENFMKYFSKTIIQMIEYRLYDRI